MNHLFKIFILYVVLWGYHTCTYAQISSKWSSEEIKKANTVEGLTYLNEIEKEAVIILNLARLYPKKFVLVELTEFKGTPKYGNYLVGSKYKESLIKTMNSMSPLSVLMPDSIMTENAKCFAIESGLSGYKGHKRKNCEKKNYAECCSYGMETGKEIILQLLIDHDVASLGHRNACFDMKYTRIGIAISKHTKWDTCGVMELI